MKSFEPLWKRQRKVAFAQWEQTLTWCWLFTATYFMTYHSMCKTNEDYISALRWARNISANITRTMNNWPWRNVSEPEPNWEDPTADDRIKHKVFPYRWGCRVGESNTRCSPAGGYEGAKWEDQAQGGPLQVGVRVQGGRIKHKVVPYRWVWGCRVGGQTQGGPLPAEVGVRVKGGRIKHKVVPYLQRWVSGCRVGGSNAKCPPQVGVRVQSGRIKHKMSPHRCVSGCRVGGSNKRCSFTGGCQGAWWEDQTQGIPSTGGCQGAGWRMGCSLTGVCEGVG